MSFRARMSLVIATLTALTLGAAFVVVSALFNGLQRQQLDASLLAVAHAEAAEAPRNAFRFSRGAGPAANDVGPLTVFGVIFDEAGRVTSATVPFEGNPIDRGVLSHGLGQTFDLTHAGKHLRAVTVAIPNHPGKRVLVATSREDLDSDEAFLFRAMFVAFLVSVAWVGIVAHWMGGRLVRDHHAIASVARSVARGDLTARTVVRSPDPEVVQLSNDINDMIDRLDELVSSQRRFIAHAAHELRSPLATLSGELQQALRKERDAESYKLAIQSALAATRRLTTLAEDLLALARIEADAAPPASVIEVDATLRLTKAAVEPLAKANETEIVCHSTPACIADRKGDTSRLLRNLLENAVRFSPRGARVLVEARVHGEMVNIAIVDSGPGVDPSERHKIFTPFFRGKGSVGTDGSGLGLGIAREIARSYGGDVQLDTSNTQGARFVVSLPVVSAER